MASTHNIIKALLGVTTCLGALGAPAPLHAEPPSQAQPGAHALRERARHAIETDDLPEARAALLALLAIAPSVDATCNLGLVARRLNLWTEAAENLTRCVGGSPPAPPGSEDEERLIELSAELSMARTQVAVVKLRAPEGTSVRIDGQSAGLHARDRELFLTPGAHAIVVGDDSKRVSLKAGSTTTLSFTATATAPRAPDSDPLVIAGLLTAGAGVAAGSILIGLSSVKNAEAQDELDIALKKPHACSSREKLDRAHCEASAYAQEASLNLRTAAIATFIGAGLVGVGAAVYTSIYMGKRKAQAPRVDVGLTSVKVVLTW